VCYTDPINTGAIQRHILAKSTIKCPSTRILVAPGPATYSAVLSPTDREGHWVTGKPFGTGSSTGPHRVGGEAPSRGAVLTGVSHVEEGHTTPSWAAPTGVLVQWSILSVLWCFCGALFLSRDILHLCPVAFQVRTRLVGSELSPQLVESSGELVSGSDQLEGRVSIEGLSRFNCPHSLVDPIGPLPVPDHLSCQALQLPLKAAHCGIDSSQLTSDLLREIQNNVLEFRDTLRQVTTSWETG